ncbi:MAG: hypothetical protein PHE27_01865 [Alphaproteobacteria bacterium]|nr:hypothetical protein [Alphaproteobacteria bacterium]
MGFLRKNHDIAPTRTGLAALGVVDRTIELERKLEQAQAERLRLKRLLGVAPLPVPYELGERVEGKGIFFGTSTIFDPLCRELGRSFYLFAAPEDLRVSSFVSATWTEAVDEIARNKKRWYGFCGKAYDSEKDLCSDLIRGDYAGEWFMPPLGFLLGVNAYGEKVRPETSLFALKDVRDFRGSFCVLPVGSDYWSCTEVHQRAGDVYFARFNSGFLLFDEKNSFVSARSRLCRAEPVPL